MFNNDNSHRVNCTALEEAGTPCTEPTPWLAIGLIAGAFVVVGLGLAGKHLYKQHAKKVAQTETETSLLNHSLPNQP